MLLGSNGVVSHQTHENRYVGPIRHSLSHSSVLCEPRFTTSQIQNWHTWCSDIANVTTFTIAFVLSLLMSNLNLLSNTSNSWTSVFLWQHYPQPSDISVSIQRRGTGCFRSMFHGPWSVGVAQGVWSLFIGRIGGDRMWRSWRRNWEFGIRRRRNGVSRWARRKLLLRGGRRRQHRMFSVVPHDHPAFHFNGIMRYWSSAFQTTWPIAGKMAHCALPMLTCSIRYAPLNIGRSPCKHSPSIGYLTFTRHVWLGICLS